MRRRRGAMPSAQPVDSETIAPRDAKQQFTRNFRVRLYNALDYLTLFTYVLIVTIGALGADLIMVRAIEMVVNDSIAQYQIVRQAFDWFRIGSAFLIFVGAGLHAVFSAWSLLRVEVEAASPDV